MPVLITEENKTNLAKLTEDLRGFLNLDLTYKATETIFLRSGDTATREVERPNTPPMLSRFARSRNLTVEQLHILADSYPPLQTVLASYEDILKEFTIHHGLLGNYDGNFSKFVLTNTTDMRDTKSIDVRKVNIHAKIAELEAEGDPLIQQPNTETQIPELSAPKPVRAFTLPSPATPHEF